MSAKINPPPMIVGLIPLKYQLFGDNKIIVKSSFFIQNFTPIHQIKIPILVVFASAIC